jgi:hypothetical protein
MSGAGPPVDDLHAQRQPLFVIRPGGLTGDFHVAPHGLGDGVPKFALVPHCPGWWQHVELELQGVSGSQDAVTPRGTPRPAQQLVKQPGQDGEECHEGGRGPQPPPAVAEDRDSYSHSNRDQQNREN